MSTVNPSTSAAIRSAITGAKPGDTVAIEPGTYAFTSSITIPSGVTVTSAGAPLSAVINFSLSGTDLFAFVAPANASNITLAGLTVRSSNAILKMMDGSQYKSIYVVDCDLSYTSGGMSGSQLIMGITATVTSDDSQVVWNTFHDDSGPGRNWYYWAPTNSKFDHNYFYNINDGGQLNSPGSNVSFSYNYGTRLRRMGQETASQDGSSLTVVGNVFWGWASVTKSSFGLSICTTGGTGKNSLVMTDNYVQVIANGTAGNCYEFGAGNCLFSRNVAGSNCEPIQMVTMMAGATGNGNRTYGQNGSYIGGEDGPIGVGSWAGSPVTYDANLANMPSPPANVIAGTAIYAATNNGASWTPFWTPGGNPVPPITPPANTLPGLTATPSSNGVVLNWTPLLSGVTIHTFTPVDNCGTLSAPTAATTATLGNLNAGWGYSATVTGTTSAGAVVSGTVGFTTAGTSPAGTVATKATLVSSVPPVVTPPMAPTVVETIQLMSDGTYKRETP